MLAAATPTLVVVGAVKCPGCGWDNPDDATSCSECRILLKHVGGRVVHARKEPVVASVDSSRPGYRESSGLSSRSSHKGMILKNRGLLALVVLVVIVAAFWASIPASPPAAQSSPTGQPPANEPVATSGTVVLRAENQWDTPKYVVLYLDANGYEPQNNFDWDWMSVSDCAASGDVESIFGGSIFVSAHGVAWMTCDGLDFGTRWVLVCSPAGDRLFTTTVSLSPENPRAEVTASLP